jgi:hypothetical protein
VTFGLLAFAVAWKFLTPDSPDVVAMEWKRVLESPLSAAVRREIPPAASPVLASVNFIEGISHAVWTPELVVLEGTFDIERLKGMAVSDGGTVKPYKKAELLAPSEHDGTYVALVSGSVVLLGKEEAIKAAIDRSEKQKVVGPSGYDLWVRTSSPDIPKHEFRLQISEGIRVDSSLRYVSESPARTAVANAQAFGLTGTQNGAEASISGHFSREDFARRTWRSAIETLQSDEGPSPVAAEQPSAHPGVIRIHGLDGGVKEIPLK